MRLSTFKEILNTANALNFLLPNGIVLPKHFHITEAGLITKKFIDCGGTLRTEEVINFQLWVANDTDHKLDATKLLHIIELSQKLFSNEDLDIEIEYQTETIGKYELDFDGVNFLLLAKQTNCLAKDNCGIPEHLNFSNSQINQVSCTPGGGCC